MSQPAAVHSPAVAARWTPFAYGFRPFFLGALIYAPLSVLAWLWLRASGALPLEAFPPSLWHGHEMIFGFTTAAIAGFLLTAVPSWTGARGFAGRPLIALTLLWLAGRLAFTCAAWAPLPALIAVELLFVPALMVLLAPPLLRARNRNTPLLAVLLVLWLADAVFLYAMLNTDVLLAMTVLRAAIGLVLLLITVIGGRIVPAFTGNALRRRGIEAPVRSWRWLEVLVIAVMVALVFADAIPPLQFMAPALAAIAALAHALRLSGWQGVRTGAEPIVWVLHVAYAWLPLGLALRAVDAWTAAPWAAHWLHALTMGAIAMMIVAVVTRASLGHTGRPLAVSRTVAVAYVFLGLAAIARIWGGALWEYEWTLRVAGGLWAIAFGLTLAVYAPILLRPRVDGRPG